MTIPDWYQTALLALAAFRTWRIVAVDDVLDIPRAYLLRYGKGWKQGDPIPANFRYGLGSFLACSACFGFWISLAWWGAFQWSPHWTTMVAVPFAISTLVIGVAKALS